MVDRISKVETSFNRVVGAHEDRRGRGSEQEQEEQSKKKRDKDKFDKNKPFWKKIIPESIGKPTQSVSARLASGEKLSPLQLRQEALLGSAPSTRPDDEEVSETVSSRFMVLWGIVDTQGHPRVKVILAYSLAITIFLVSLIMLIGVLWR